MRVIVAGSRSIRSFDIVREALDFLIDLELIKPTAIVSGTAIGVDTLGEEYAQLMNLEVHRFPANWEFHGRSAGYIRNTVMADNADVLVALWDGESRGTKHMIDIMNDRNKPVYVWRVQ